MSLTLKDTFPKASVCNTYLADHELVTIVVAGQVGEDASSTCHYIDVITAQQLDQGPQEALHSLLKSRGQDRGGECTPSQLFSILCYPVLRLYNNINTLYYIKWDSLNQQGVKLSKHNSKAAVCRMSLVKLFK